MVPGTIPGVFQAMLLGPLISLAGSRKLGMLAWKPFDRGAVTSLTALIGAGEVRPVIDRRYPLEEVSDALRYQEEGRSRGKIVITMGRSR